MLAFDAPELAALVSKARGAPLLVEMDFATGTQFYALYGDHVRSGGQLYIGTGPLASISGLSESDDLAARSLTISYTVVNKAMLAFCTGPAGNYRNKKIRIYIQLIGEKFEPIGAKKLRWAGFMDMISVERSAPAKPEDDPGIGKISLKCSRAGVPMSRRAIGLRSTDQQQRARYNDDRFLEFQQGLIETPTVWVTKKFQEQR